MIVVLFMIVVLILANIIQTRILFQLSPKDMINNGNMWRTELENTSLDKKEHAKLYNTALQNVKMVSSRLKETISEAKKKEKKINK